MDIKLFAGSSHPELAQAVAKEAGLQLTPLNLKKFASNEIYAQVSESVRGADVYLIQTATGRVNEELIELFIILDSLKRSFAGKIHVIMPYFAYARQDRVAEPREPISARLMANLIESAGADHVVSFELHTPQIQGFFANPMDNVSAMKLFIAHFKGLINQPNDWVVVSPDAGFAKQAKKMADALGLGLAIINKTRSAHNESEVTHVMGQVEGKHCIIYDDMIDTAGSVCNAKAALESMNVQDVYLAATHPVFSGPAYERLKEAGFKQVVVTDTIPLDPSQKFEGIFVLSIAPMIAQIIHNVHEQKSLTDVFK